MRIYRRLPINDAMGLLLVSVALAVMLIAFMNLRQRLYFTEIGRVAGRVERGIPVGEDRISRAGSIADALGGQGVCLSDVVKSGLTVELRRLDGIDQIRDFPQWVEIANRTDVYLLHAVSCLPTNGNFWLRMAMVRQAIAEVPTSLEHFMRLSQLYAPAEADVLRARLLLLGRLSPIGLSALAPIWKADVKVACGQRFSWSVKGLPPARPEVRSYLAEIAGDADGSRLPWCRP